ncbi:OsmC family peroxiredoxin [Sporolactobacillus shoreae]|uniref:OsmC family peroxiredoxin n=1 Tax=Sporolactobacillus shoreae TaxID=1465501 RepID=A0A4Z0GQY3_9BACL|nr:OsmC family protein [Sporolactobacillus shoreae]TGA98493.1 OsmC family peroxiredoxin [Sporolactobacillus shoreae]
MELIQSSETIELVHENGNWLLSRQEGFSPVQLIAASAAACSSYVFEELLNRQRIPYQLIKVSFEYMENPFYPNPISKIDVRFLINVPKKNQEAAKQIFLQIPQNCPVIQSLHPRIKLNESVFFAE